MSTGNGKPLRRKGPGADRVRRHEFELSEQDRAHLEGYEKKMQLVRDRTVQVARRWATGLFLWGEGGIGKSYELEETLKAEDANWLPSNSRVTGRGLFDLLFKLPDTIHVIEDAEQMLRDRAAVGVLRSPT